MRRRLLCSLSVLGALLGASMLAPPASRAEGPPTAERGSPHHEAPARLAVPVAWNLISQQLTGIADHASLWRTADDRLHVVYDRHDAGLGMISFVTIRPNGTIVNAGDVLDDFWLHMDFTPILTGTPDGGLRVVFGGVRSSSPGFWSDGRMYTATSDAAGTSWTLPAEAIGLSTSAYQSYGTAATTLFDGTPIAAFSVDDTMTWHVGTGSDPDQSFTVPGAYLYDSVLVRDAAGVWVAWQSLGVTDAATTGTFVRKLHPGPPEDAVKAPGSSVGPNVVVTDRVAFARRSGGGLFLAYCVGYPTCAKVRLWKVGTTTTVDVPRSKGALTIALASGPGGRLWLAWQDGTKVSVVRTDKTGLTLGGPSTLRVPYPKRSTPLDALAIEGSTTSRLDVVLSNFGGFWHAQFKPALLVGATPSSWKHGKATTVTFRVTDAGAKSTGATVKIGSRSCVTKAKGTCAITFPKNLTAGLYLATATKGGYAKGTTELRVT